MTNVTSVEIVSRGLIGTKTEPRIRLLSTTTLFSRIIRLDLHLTGSLWNVINRVLIVLINLLIGSKVIKMLISMPINMLIKMQVKSAGTRIRILFKAAGF